MFTRGWFVLIQNDIRRYYDPQVQQLNQDVSFCPAENQPAHSFT